MGEFLRYFVKHVKKLFDGGLQRNLVECAKRSKGSVRRDEIFSSHLKQQATALIADRLPGDPEGLVSV